jgi:carbon-monoxide dehydrogenase medium subunit
MYNFTFHRPATIRQAANLLAKNEDAKLLAGGHTIIPTMKQRLASPPLLVDLSLVEGLTGIEMKGRSIVIGAMTRHAEVATSPVVQQNIPALAYLANRIGDPAVRNMGTIGGSLANSDPAADYPAAALGLGATITTNKRKIEADKFFTGLYETALQAGELITSVSFPAPKRAAYMKFKNPASRFAIVGVFVADFGGKVRVGVTGAGACAFRQTDMEKALSAKFAPESVASIKVKPDGLNNDLHASPEYRAHLITVMAKRAVESALK